MTDETKSPRLTARLAGLIYLMVAIAGGFGEVFVRSRLIVSGNAAATATNIMANESLFRLGFATDIAAMAGEIVLAYLFYKLFEPVSRNLATLIAFFRVAWASIFAAVSLLHIAPLLMLNGAPYLSALPPSELDALAFLSLKLHALGFNVGLVFFGIDCVLIGWAIMRATFMPRIIGVLMAIAGICYLINSFANFLAPPLASLMFPTILFPCLPAEFGLILWLLIVGVNPEKWKAQAGVGEAEG